MTTQTYTGGLTFVNDVTITGNFSISGTFEVDSLDRDSAGVFTLAGVNATSVDIADTGVKTTIKGTMDVDEAATFVSTITMNTDAALTMGAGGDLVIVHGGTDSSITSSTGNLTLENSASTADLIAKLGSATTTTSFLVQSSASTNLLNIKGDGSAAFSSSIDAAGSITTDSSLTVGTTITMNTDSALTMGTGGDLVITHNGTNSSITSSTGDLIIENDATTADVIARLGTATALTSFLVQDSASSNLLNIKADGSATFSGSLTMSGDNTLTIGAGSDLAIAHDGTNSTITTANGDLILENNASTSDVIARLGSATTTTSFLVQDSANSNLLNIKGDGSATFSSSITMSGDDALTMGAGSDLVITHNGTNSTITSSVGDLILENDATAADVIARLGTASSTTSFLVQDSASSNILNIKGDGSSEFTGTVTKSNSDALTTCEVQEVVKAYQLDDTSSLSTPAVLYETPTMVAGQTFFIEYYNQIEYDDNGTLKYHFMKGRAAYEYVTTTPVLIANTSYVETIIDEAGVLAAIDLNVDDTNDSVELRVTCTGGAAADSIGVLTKVSLSIVDRV